jgi:hypothetical protein
MRRHLLLILIAAGALGGCGLTAKDASQQQLASGCQIVKCVCQKVRDSFLPRLSKPDPQEPLWRPDGTAYCAAGYALERRDGRSIYDRPFY